MSLDILIQQRSILLAPIIMTGAQLRELRRSYGVSQKRLAHGIHYSERQVQNFESGKYHLTIPIQNAILAYFVKSSSTTPLAS